MLIWIAGAVVMLALVAVLVLLVGMNGCRREEREDWTKEGGRKW